MDAVGKMGYQRIVVAFQPHTYSRLKNLFEDFVQVLSIPDKLYLADVYAAREKDVFGISSADLAARIPGSTYCRSFAELCEKLRGELREGDMFLTVGAGDIYKVGEMLLDKDS